MKELKDIRQAISESKLHSKDQFMFNNMIDTIEDKLKLKRFSNESIKQLGNKACELYSDVDVPIWACIERFLCEDVGLDKDDSFDLSSDISDRYALMIYNGTA